MYAELVAMLEREVATRLTRHLQDQGKLRQVTVGIVIEPRKRRMVINFGPGYLPGKKDSYGELFLEPLAADLRRYSERSGMESLDVEFLFQGKSMDEHFPEDHPPVRDDGIPISAQQSLGVFESWIHCLASGRGMGVPAAVSARAAGRCAEPDIW